MSKPKPYRLQIDLKDISGIPASLVQCKIEVAAFSAIVDSKTPLVCDLDEVSLSTVITITLAKHSEALGSSRVSFKAMFGESLFGKVEKWVRVKEISQSGRDLKVKISGNLFMPQEKVQKKPEKTLDYSVCKSVSSVPVKCPFIEKVAQQEESLEKISQIWEKRTFLGDLNIERSIRITLEPETIQKPGAEQATYAIPSIESLDMQRLKGLGGFQLKKTLKTLAEELKLNLCSSLNLPLARNSLMLKVKERLEKHKEAKELTHSIETHAFEKSEELRLLFEQKNQLSEGLLTEELNCREAERQIDSIRSEILFETSEILKIKAELIRYGDAGKVHKELSAQVKEGLTRKTTLEKSFQDAESKLRSLREKTEAQREKLRKEKEELSRVLKDLSKRKDSALSENNYLKRQLNDIKQRLNPEQNIKQLLKEARTSSMLEGSRRDQAYFDLQDFINTVQSQIEDLKSKHKTLISGKKLASQSISSLEHELESKENSIVDLKRKIFEATAFQISLEELYCIKSDVASLLEEITKLQKVHNEGRDVILKGLEQGIEHVLKESDLIIEETRQLDCMIDSLDNRDFELDNLKIMVGEAKTRTAPYMPKPDDPLDIALSEYLNSLNEPISIPFTRENEGTYMFGTKRIFLKLENNQIRIRVGGGYTNIQEFIEIYTATELERQEEAIEETPAFSETLNRFFGKPGMSPQRAARIIQSSVEALDQGSPLKSIRKAK